MLANWNFCSLDSLVGVILITLIVGSIISIGTADIKKIVAAISIVHMAAGICSIFGDTPDGEMLFGISWNHHSVVTTLIFAFIGFFYSSSGTRLTRLTSAGFWRSPLSVVALLALFTFCLDMPVTANAVVELALFAGTSKNLNVGVYFSLLVIFLVLIFNILKVISGRECRLSTSRDASLAFLAISTLTSTFSFLLTQC